MANLAGDFRKIRVNRLVLSLRGSLLPKQSKSCESKLQMPRVLVSLLISFAQNDERIATHRHTERDKREVSKPRESKN